MAPRTRFLHASLLCIACVAMAAGCADTPGGPDSGDEIEIAFSFERLPSLDTATEGIWQAWVVSADGDIASAGRFASTTDVRLRSPVSVIAHVFITLEPPGDHDDFPSLMKLLGGDVRPDDSALLTTETYLSPEGIPLEPQPGVHVLGTPSNGNGTLEDSGLWLADTRVDSTHRAFYQSFAPLTLGWTYEGWVVRDEGTAGEVWISYGQFLPNNLRKARFRDDTGIGPFSGLSDWEHAMQSEIHYPGDDFLANPHGYAVPGGVALPIDLNGDAVKGEPSRWTHVITIEPWYEPNGERTEKPWEAKPFFLRPYRNAIGEAAASVPRTIESRLEAMPAGIARLHR